MRKLSGNALPAVIGAIVAAVAVTAIAFAAGGATISKSKLKVKCPTNALAGKKVTCRVVGRLPQGPQGPQGARGRQGQKGEKGAKGDDGPRGFAGIAGVSGYEVISQPFKEVFIQNSGGMRGLSEVKTVACPSGKRVIGGGSDLGTDPAQNGQQRQVSVSLNAPNGNGTGWSVQLFNNSTSLDTSIDLTVYAICATAN